MIRINLLPFRATKKTENIKRQISIFAGLLLLLIVGLAGYHFKLSSDIDELNTKVESIKLLVQKEERKAKQVDKIKKDLATLNKKIEVISALKLRREEAVRFLDAMARMVIAKRMWLTNLEAKGAVVNIKGVALDNKTVADYMTRLQGANYLGGRESAQKDGESHDEWKSRVDQSKWFASVNLNSVSQTTIKNNNLKKFQITCQRKPMKKPETGKAKK